MTNFEKVREFHKVFNHLIKTKPEMPKDTLKQLRIDLIQEEFDEFVDGVENGNLTAVADALTDLLYVVYGAGLVFGIDLDKTFEEVHNSNMSKLGEDGKPIYREDGKVLKGPNFKEPDFSFIFK